MTGNTRKKVKYLGAEQIAEAVEEIAILAGDERVHVALLGGVAMQLYGSDRLTKDVDILAERRIKALRPEKALSFGGEQTHTPGGIPVDVIRRNDIWQALYDAALEHAVRVRGVPLPVVRSEYLAAIKMAAGRPKDEADLAFLLATDQAGHPKIRRVVTQFLGLYAGDEFDALVAEVSWRKKVGKL